MTAVNRDYSVWPSGRKGAPLGPHTVMVTTIADPSATQVAPAEMRSDDPRYADQANSEAADYVKAAKKTPQDPIPAKYNKNSELRYTVESGGGEFNIDIVK